MHTIEIVCPSCNALLHAPIEAVGHHVQCPSCGAKATVPPDVVNNPLRIATEETSLGSHRATVERVGSRETLGFWLALGGLGVGLAGYAVHLANRSVMVSPPPPKIIRLEPQPVPDRPLRASPRP